MNALHGPTRLQAEPPSAARVAARRPRRLRNVGLALVLVGVLAIAMPHLIERLSAGKAKDSLQQSVSDVRRDWSSEPGSTTAQSWSTAKSGATIGIIRIPKFGADYEIPIIAGASEKNLTEGVTWFTNTASAGRVGNVALIGHRVTHGEPFRRFPELRRGDHVIIETAATVFTYQLDEDGSAREVDHSETWILDPPQDPSTSQITLITCARLFHSDVRSVTTGTLIDTRAKSS